MAENPSNEKPAPERAVTLTLPAALARAVSAHRSGDLAVAEKHYAAILAAKPDQFDALHLLGALRAGQGRLEEARRLIAQALVINPASAEANANLGYALSALNRSAEALAQYERALTLKPDFPEALCNRANILCQLDRHEESLADYRRAIALRPDYAEAYYNLGYALHRLGRDEQAVAAYDRAIELRPRYVDALNNRGNALKALHRHEAALASYDGALATDPNHVMALVNRGNTLRDLRRLEDALGSYDRALSRQPDLAEALINRGNALYDLRRPEEALADYTHALELAPDASEALVNRASVLQDLQRHEDAVRNLEHLRELGVSLPYAGSLLPYSRLHGCDWRDYDASIAELTAEVGAGRPSAMPFQFLCLSDSAEAQLACAKTWVRDRCPALAPPEASPRRAAAAPLAGGARVAHQRLRLAYLSADFHGHATAYLMAGLFERHDRRRFETIAVSFGPDASDPMRLRLSGAFDRFIDVRLRSDAEVARLVRDLGADIAVDLKGFTQHSRPAILAYRPAPVQVSFLGYPGTTGAAHIDYIIADRVVLPDALRGAFSERVAWLPDTYQPNDSERPIGAHTPSRAEAGLPESGFVLCSFNNAYKITPPIFDIWMRLLRAVEGSVLWLLESNEAAARNLRREAAERGIAPERLMFAPKLPQAEHLARHRLADLFLDTLPVNAHTTASDALWAGLPVLTCLGATFAGRVAASLLHAVGLPELVTTTLEDYEALALRLAREGDALAALKAKLACQRDTHPLFDTDRFRRHLEAAYLTIWQRHRRGEPPADFTVDPIER
jgi:predicted O-linked N-acetylglucosamine transferase (SPINDLY family)